MVIFIEEKHFQAHHSLVRQAELLVRTEIAKAKMETIDRNV